MDDIQSKLFPIQGSVELAAAVDTLEATDVLDVGFGYGGASLLFAHSGKNVDALGVNLASYAYPKQAFEFYGINAVEADFLRFNSDKKYDLVWMSHVIEHSTNPGLMLKKARRHLKKDGWLCVAVPPFKHEIVGGHVSTGWNLGQLMYNLLLAKFDIKHGYFIKHGYNLFACVKPDLHCEIDDYHLRSDIGDLETTSELWPIPITQGYNGNINEVRWRLKFKFISLAESQKILNNIVSTIKKAEEDKHISKLINSVQEQKEQIRLLQNRIEKQSELIRYMHSRFK